MTAFALEPEVIKVVTYFKDGTTSEMRGAALIIGSHYQEPSDVIALREVTRILDTVPATVAARVIAFCQNKYSTKI